MRRFALCLLISALFGSALAGAIRPALAQTVPVPGFWDPGRRNDRPDMTRVGAIRFVTEEDFPPFHFRNAAGQLAGFDIDLARAICEELGVPCTIQMRRFDKMLEAIDTNQGDAALGGHFITTDLRRRYDLSERYFQTPARFVIRKDKPLASSGNDALRGKTLGALTGSSHAAFLDLFYRTSTVKTFADENALREALKAGNIDAAFGNALNELDLVHGPKNETCCAFALGPFTESRFFGEGMAIVMKKGNQPLRAAINHALQRLWDRGVYREIYLRHFPVSLF